MIIKEVQAKTIITKSKLPESDFVINPYTGCSHACIYCYARFMKRFTGHEEPWGAFVDAKVNAPKLVPIKAEKYAGKSITIGSVTDAYQACEEKYQITRKILEKLVSFDVKFDIITKSALVTRDIDLLKQFKNLTVAFSLAFSDDKVIRNVEPGTDSFEKRVAALQKLHENGIRTAVFVSPIFPLVSDWKEVILKTKDFADEYWFENLNIYPSVRENIYRFLKNTSPELTEEYHKIYQDERGYWNGVEAEIKAFCKENKIKYKIYFHHKELKKK